MPAAAATRRTADNLDKIVLEEGPGGGDQADDSKKVVITGGTLSIDAEGDGLDSNGNVTMSGGIVIVNGPTQGGNGALDYNGTFEITGGTLVAAGTTDMAMNVSGGTQRSVAITFDQSPGSRHVDHLAARY